MDVKLRYLGIGVASVPMVMLFFIPNYHLAAVEVGFGILCCLFDIANRPATGGTR